MATNSNSISQIIESLKSQMISLGYKQATIERYDAVWSGLIAFCNENYGGKFTLEAGRFYVWSQYGLQLGDADTSHNVNRAIMLIDDFQTYGVVYVCSRNHIKQFSEKYNIICSLDSLNI